MERKATFFVYTVFGDSSVESNLVLSFIIGPSSVKIFSFPKFVNIRLDNLHF